MTSYSKLSDTELTNLLRNGDHGAYAEIYERYKGILYRHALQMISSKEEVNDLIHELFLVLWVKREELNVKFTLSSYLYSAIRNRILDFIAREKFVSAYIDSIQEYIQRGVPETEQQVILHELQLTIEREVALLPSKMREIFELSRKQELTHKEIADKLNLSEKTVKKQISNAIKILKPKINMVISGIFII